MIAMTSQIAPPAQLTPMSAPMPSIIGLMSRKVKKGGMRASMNRAVGRKMTKAMSIPVVPSSSVSRRTRIMSNSLKLTFSLLPL